MDCGIACLRMICRYHGGYLSESRAKKICFATTEGVSMMALKQAAETLGFSTVCGKISLDRLAMSRFPCVLYWNQNHFVVLYNYKHNHFYIADPAKGNIRYSKEEFRKHWISDYSQNEEKGIGMFFEPNHKFSETNLCKLNDSKTFEFIWRYVANYHKLLTLIISCLTLGCVLQLIMPFLTQWIVDLGIKHSDIKLIWLILLGELMIVIGRAATDFIRRWLLHISMRINISLVSDFFIKLLKLPLSFFDTKLMVDLLQRINDHSRVQSFLTNQTLNMTFTLLSFIVLGIVLLAYDKFIFLIFLIGSILYGTWITNFLSKRKALDYELFE